MYHHWGYFKNFFFISTKLCSNSTIQQFKNCVLITKYQHKQFYGVFSPKKNKGDENTVCDKIKIETKDWTNIGLNDYNS